MITQSKYTKIFKSNDMTRLKYNELYDFAVLIRNHKNTVSDNIKNRVSITVLCNSLLKQLDNGAYEPKKLKREKVKEVLLSFRRNLQKVGSECIECSMTTFDYV